MAHLRKAVVAGVGATAAALIAAAIQKGGVPGVPELGAAVATGLAAAWATWRIPNSQPAA